MRTVLIMCACAICFAPFASAAAPPAPPLPKAGDSVRIDGDAQKLGQSRVLGYDTLRIGEPDSEKFEEACRPEMPFSVEVIGVIDETIVGRYRTSAKPGDFMACANGSVILTDRAGWAALRSLETAAAREKAAKEKRREQIRQLIKPAAAPPKPAK